MARVLTFLLLLGAVLAAQGHGPYYGKPDWVCHRGETVSQVPAGQKKRVHCECRHRCDENGRALEDGTCQTYCADNKQCVCHTDEPCEVGH